MEDVYSPNKINRKERQAREVLNFFAFFAGLAVQKVI